ncbi:MAG: hypothetical protein OXU38_13745 [Gemmatimonadota bacterium]|nr:hypothetical protein [Gemmatimonadota bacterium]
MAAAAVLLAAAACSADPQTEDGASAPSERQASEQTFVVGVTRGMMVMGPEVRTLKPCEEETELWLVPIESVQRAYEALASEPHAPVFVEVEGIREPAPAVGFGADYSGQLRLTSLIRAESAVEGLGCDENLLETVFRATGQEPFWHVRVLRDRIVLATPDIPSTIFSGARPFPLDDGWRFEALSTGPETVHLRLDVTRGSCTDSMVGSMYTWVASLNVGGQVRRGCAWEGRLAPGRGSASGINR